MKTRSQAVAYGYPPFGVLPRFRDNEIYSFVVFEHQRVRLAMYYLLLPGLDRLLEPYGHWIWLTCLALVLGVRHVVQRLRGHSRFKWLGLLASVVLLTPLVDIGPHFALAPLWIYAFFSLRTLVVSLIIWLIVYFLLIVITGLWRKLHRWRSSGTTRS